ncbi:S-layer domain-like protein [Candidatus Haloredivivus sp. G17]|nr:S-layer domain-like protein [Candidatus Haloredivivus sp. G17]
MTYTSGDSSSEITEDVSFDVNLEGRPQFEITEVESELQTGSSRELRLTVENTGDEEASSTRIRVLDSSDQPFTYDSSSQYIGTLEPNQSGTAVFDVDTESDPASAKDYLIDFEVRGVKGSEVFVEDSTVEASVSNGESSSSPVIPVVAVIVVLGIVGFIFRDRIREKFSGEE